MGYPVFYSDQVAKQILGENPDVISKVQALFGPKAYEDNKPDHKFLAEVVFNEPEKLGRLNEIIHPAVRQSFSDWAKQLKSPIVFNEAAILFESGSYLNFSKTILVVSPEHLRVKRLLMRDHTSEEKIKSRMKNQWNDDQKIPLADFIIQNDEELLIMPQLIGILNKLTV